MSTVPMLITIVFWGVIGVLVYTYVGYPILLTAIAAFRRNGSCVAGAYTPTVSVLIAARNEEASIGRKLEETLALDYPADRLEIVVVSDGSTDRTDEIVKQCRDPRVRLIRVDAHLGKTHAQNVGVAECRGEVIVFSDVTARYDKLALRNLARHYKDPRIGAVSGRYRYFDPSRTSPTGAGSIVFWDYENLIKKLQSRIGTLTGCSGCIYSVRQSAYQPLPASACSDLVEPLYIVRSGLRVMFEDQAVAYEETTKSSRQEFVMRVRVATRGIRGILGVPDLLNFRKHGWISFQLLSHKFLRWLVPLWLFILFVASGLLSGERGYLFLFLLQVAFYVFVGLSAKWPVYRRWWVLGLPLFFVTINAAVLVAFWKLVRGQRYAVWETDR